MMGLTRHSILIHMNYDVNLEGVYLGEHEIGDYCHHWGPM